MYNSLILSKKYPYNKFLRLNIAYCLYAMAKYKNESNLNEVLLSSENIRGEKQKFNFFIEQLSEKELNILAVRYLWNLKKMGSNKFLGKISSDALKELIYSQKIKRKNFKKEYPSMVDSNGDDLPLDSIERDAILYAFVDQFKNTDFVKEFKFHEREKEKNTKEEEENDDKIAKNVIRNDMYKINRGRALGIDKVALVSPNVRSFDARKNGYEKFFHGEERKDIFIELNEFCANKRQIDLELLSTVTFENSEKYSNISLLNDWVEERFGHGETDIYPFLSLYSDDLEKKYGTNYYMWSGLYTLRMKKYAGNYFLFFLGSALVGIPASIYYALSDSQHTFYYTYLFDIENGDALMIKNEYFKSKDRKDFMKAYIYDTYNQVKQNNKKWSE